MYVQIFMIFNLSVLRQFNMMIKEHNALDGNYKDAVRFLYKNESKFRVKTASCSRVFEQCTGTATIRLEVKAISLNIIS